MLLQGMNRISKFSDPPPRNINGDVALNTALGRDISLNEILALCLINLLPRTIIFPEVLMRVFSL